MTTNLEAVATFKLEPGAEISTAVTDGEELRFQFDAKGLLEVPDDFQEALVALADSPAKRVKKESN